MYRLSSIIFVLLLSMPILAQSPHGNELTIDCAQCHTSENWLVNVETIKFNHNELTEFNLEGTHTEINCKECHTTLVFEEAQNQCISCHTDMHSASVGDDCARCHTAESWVVNIIPELHEQNGFPLVGGHTTLDCVECHTSETNLRFDRLGNDCINCHQSDFNETENPNHTIADFSTDCTECHSIFETEWSSGNFNHDSFPLTLGHDIQDCKECHQTNKFTDTSPECINCHQNDFDNSINPNHINAEFSTDCTTCHTTNPEWTPANWNHDFYALNGAHTSFSDDCIACHKPELGNYSNTPSTCVGCHLEDFNATTEPNHSQSNFSTDCTFCHTEDSWIPSTFNHDSFPLTLGHDIDDCTQCHTTTSYADTSSECINCHQNDFDNSINPNHINAGFSTECTACHTTGGWTPATFDHDSQYFPIYSGNHRGEWDTCTDCHTANNYSTFSCIDCHEHSNKSEVDNDHRGENGYVYESNACYSCHPDGRD